MNSIAPIMESSLPKLAYSAAFIGPGSEVLGFDTKRSTDHDWGPRLQVFVHAGHAREVSAVLDKELPVSFLGHRVRFAPDGTHRVLVTDIDTWCHANLGFDPRRDPTLLDWLATPTQRLAEFRDCRRRRLPILHKVPFPGLRRKPGSRSDACPGDDPAGALEPALYCLTASASEKAAPHIFSRL